MSAVIEQYFLNSQWETEDPFLFCAHHLDNYPQGNKNLGPVGPLNKRKLGQDFDPKNDWRMYHGLVVPGFPEHPHRGFETVTIVAEGIVDHFDSNGASGRYSSGDVQWLTAGKGIQHCEMFPLLKTDEPNPLHLFQIWLNLPKKSKFVKPHYKMLWNEDIPIASSEDKAKSSTSENLTDNIVSTEGSTTDITGDISATSSTDGVENSSTNSLEDGVENSSTDSLIGSTIGSVTGNTVKNPAFISVDSTVGGYEVRVIAGEFEGVKALKPAPESWAADPANHVDILLVSMAPNARFKLPCQSKTLNRNLYFYEGSSLAINGEEVLSNHRAKLSQVDLQIENNGDHAKFIILQGEPIGEPVVQYGPFVMNTQQEIQEAFEDYRVNQFGGWPWDKSDPVHPAEVGRVVFYPDGKESRPNTK